MTDPRRTLHLFEQAVVLDETARGAFLDRECNGDSPLRAEVDALIKADSQAGDFLTRPVHESGNRTGERLGSYRLTALIGTGGMGTVYRAERADRAFAKPVAIKLLLFDAGDLRTRFALEQRILGALSHPNIASLLDVGQETNGAPYLVMEYVEGLPITRYVHDHQLDLRARIELFRKILDAMQMAHTQLVVHRDIKPGNVLVDAHDEPKLLDFGIAKLLDGSVSAATRTGLGPLTPEYASPEQVRGEPIGTGSDIYSLGVLLYELATGERPYRIDDTRPAAVEHVICDTDPVRPSQRLSTQRADGNRRDLDAVILKAMQKRPADRYASCAAFAEDLQRWLDGVQVLAREPAIGERAARFVRRHRFAVSVAATAILALLIGFGFALWQAREATLARNRAQRINEFLQDMLGAADHSSLGRNAKLGDVLDTAKRNAEHVLADDPATLGETELTLTRAYDTLGDLDNALQSGNLALSVGEKSKLPSLTLEAQLALANVYVNRGEFDAAEKILKDARAQAETSGTPRQRGESAGQFGFLEVKRDNLASAERWLKTSLGELPDDAMETRAAAMNDLAVTQESEEKFPAALKTIDACIDMLRNAYPNGHPLLSQAIGNLAGLLDDAGDHAAASAKFDEALKMKIHLLGEDHFSVIGTLSTMTWRSVQQKDTAAALSYGSRAWAGAQKLSPENPAISYAAITYAQALMQAGRAGDALPIAEAALRLRKANLPADNAFVINTESVVALATAEAGDIGGGESLARSAYERLAAKLGEKNQLVVTAKDRLDQIDALRKTAQR
jgi:serine/threonine-protein kinase